MSSKLKVSVTNQLAAIDYLLVGFLLMKWGGIGKVAEWSWWIVLMPLWIQMAMKFLVALVEARKE